MLSDHQPVNHQEMERLNIGEITEGITVNTVNRKEYCAQAIISELEDRRAQLNSTKSDTVMFEVKNEHCAQSIISELEDTRAQRTSPESNTVVIEAEIHAESTDAQQMVHFEEAQDLSDAGSLITQAPQSNTIHATINTPFDVDVCNSTTRIMVPRRVDRRFPHRFSDRPRSGHQCYITTML